MWEISRVDKSVDSVNNFLRLLFKKIMVNLVDYGSGMADSICSKTGRCEPLKGVSGRRGRPAGMPSSASACFTGIGLTSQEKRVYKAHQSVCIWSRLRVFASLTGTDHLQCQLGPYIG